MILAIHLRRLESWVPLAVRETLAPPKGPPTEGSGGGYGESMEGGDFTKRGGYGEAVVKREFMDAVNNNSALCVSFNSLSSRFAFLVRARTGRTFSP